MKRHILFFKLREGKGKKHSQELTESRGQEHGEIFKLSDLQVKDEPETEPKLLTRPLESSEVRQNQQRFHYSQIPPDALNNSYQTLGHKDQESH